MKRKLMGFFLALTLLLALVACGNTQENEQAVISPANEPEAVSTQVKITEEKETYPEIEELFLEVVPDAEIHVTLRNGSTIYTKIKTQLSSESAPDEWPEIISAFETALISAEEKKSDYNASAASAEILSADEIILASGYDGKLQFTKFEERDFESNEVTTSIDPEGNVFEILEEVYVKLDEASENMVDSSSSDIVFGSGSSSSIVYVSSRHIIHSNSGCSGMKNYTSMSQADADGKGYRYCPNCW